MGGNGRALVRRNGWLCATPAPRRPSPHTVPTTKDTTFIGGGRSFVPDAVSLVPRFSRHTATVARNLRETLLRLSPTPRPPPHARTPSRTLTPAFPPAPQWLPPNRAAARGRPPPSPWQPPQPPGRPLAAPCPPWDRCRCRHCRQPQRSPHRALMKNLCWLLVWAQGGPRRWTGTGEGGTHG